MTAKLFTPFELGRLRLANRIVVAPMCTYSASEGCANDWHLIHYGQLALSGAGLLTVEATSPAAKLPRICRGWVARNCRRATPMAGRPCRLPICRFRAANTPPKLSIATA
jgi:hypothetical protein